MSTDLDRIPDLKRRLGIALRSTPRGDILHSWVQEAEDSGVPASARLTLSAQPATTDTIGIGSDTYEFVSSNGNVADDANIAVEIGASAADTRDNLIAAINADDDDNVHPNINNVADTAGAKANGTENVVADEIGTDVRIRTADAPGGNVTGADLDAALAESITDAADVWDVGNVNLNTLAGRARSGRAHAVAVLTVTAGMISTGDVRVDFPFTPSRFVVQVRDSSGVVRGHGADAFVIGNDGVVVTLNGGADPDIQATDVLTVEAWE